MDTGDRFYKYMQSTIHSSTLSVEEKSERLKRDFLRSVGGVPEEFLEEMFALFFMEDVRNDTDLIHRSEQLPELVGLLNENFDDRRDPFSREQWHLIGEVISEFGSELDESLLNYVMTRVVDRRAL